VRNLGDEGLDKVREFALESSSRASDFTIIVLSHFF
jgi:hypothetical protein